MPSLPGKLPLSVVIIARDEEANIARAIKSAPFASEVVVVDGGSADGTIALAESLGARVVSRAWTNFGEQRNFSIAQAKHGWVLVLDADEAATESLRLWLENFFATGSDQRAPYGYKIFRAEYFLGRQITGACWSPNFQDRFFRRDKAKYVGVIHEYPEVEGGFERLPMSVFLEHSRRVTADSFFEKMNHYTSIEAYDRYDLGQRTSLPHVFIAFLATFWRNYVYYKAYRDGAYGFIVSVMESISRTVRHVKLWQIQEMHRRGEAHLLLDPRKKTGGSRARSLESGAVNE